MQNAELQLHLRRLCDQLGVSETARRLGIQRETLARLCAGLPVRQGTILAAEKALQALASVPIFGEATDR